MFSKSGKKSNNEISLNISINYDIPWNFEKINRDFLQNFYDAQVELNPSSKSNLDQNALQISQNKNKRLCVLLTDF